MIPGAINMLVDEENIKLKDQIAEYQAISIVKDIQKQYDDRHDQIDQLNGAIQQYNSKSIPQSLDNQYLSHI